MLRLLKFSANWCGPCRAMKTIIETLKIEESDVEFEEIDIDEDQETSSQFSIKAIPTIVFLKDGKEVDRLIGLNDKASIKAKIDTWR
jgi:thioredoxin 1